MKASTKQCSSCGGNCGGTKKTGCLYVSAHEEKLKIAVELPMREDGWKDME